MKLKYECRHCGAINFITSFWEWFCTPHMGAKKYLRCGICGNRHFMKRVGWNHPWIDWPGGGEE